MFSLGNVALELKNNQTKFPLLMRQELLDVYVMKTLHTSNGCGYSKGLPNAACAETGSN